MLFSRAYSTAKKHVNKMTTETKTTNNTDPESVPPPSNNHPLLLLPGMMLDHGLWQKMMPQLSSISPIIYADLSLDATIEAMAKRALSHSPSRFTLVGFSMGGFVARAIMRIAPERVERLILIASSVRPDSPDTLSNKEKIAAGLSLHPGRFRGLGQKVISASLSPQNENDETLHQIIKEMSVRVGEKGYLHQLMLKRPDDKHRLAEYKCPTLVIAARKDRLRTVEESKEMANAIPGAKLVIIEESGHMIPLEQPGPLLKVISEWLEANPSK